MKTRSEHTKKWNDLVDRANESGVSFRENSVILDVLLDVKEVLEKINDRMEEDKKQWDGCKNCGLLQKFWDKGLCLEGRNHY